MYNKKINNYLIIKTRVASNTSFCDNVIKIKLFINDILICYINVQIHTKMKYIDIHLYFYLACNLVLPWLTTDLK